METLKDLIDDKGLVIVGVLILGLASLFKPPEDPAIIMAIITGLFGVAVGKGLK